jgi:ABC-type transport system involved in multi-copper enzyme maturation permease subunit
MILITLKGIFRDRVFRGLLLASLAIVSVPAISTLSMRQVTELSLTLCLSLISFILLLLSIFLGGAVLWKDLERRYSLSVLSLPLSRTRYLFGRFAGIALFLLGTAVLLGTVAALVVLVVSHSYPPDRPVVWSTVVLAVGFDAFRCILLVAFAIFFSSLSTSFFLPIFGTIAVYLVGGASQQAYDYVQSSIGQRLDPMVRESTSLLYYVVPNLSAFDLKVNAIYALPVDSDGLALTAAYFVVYTALVLLLAAVIFARRELG